MREILFRAKRIDTGEWVEGFPFLMYWDGCEMWCIGVNPLSANDYSEIIGQNVDWFFIDPETLCQYTGLTDKNGKRIWENDIVLCKKYIGGNFVDYCIEYGYVEMKYGAFGIHRLNPDAYYRPFKDWLEDYEYEVIGNIFDNPELLKGDIE